MNDFLERVLFSEQELNERITALAEQITKDYEGKTPVAVCVLKGSFPFFADLVRKIKLDVAVDFVAISSYGSGACSSGNVKIRKDLDKPIEGRDVIIIEDIVDSGNTMKRFVELLKERNPASIKICTLLDKPSRREVDVKADYVGFEVSNEFVIGYGLDYDEKFRNLPFVGVLKRSYYEE